MIARLRQPQEALDFLRLQFEKADRLDFAVLRKIFQHPEAVAVLVLHNDPVIDVPFLEPAAELRPAVLPVMIHGLHVPPVEINRDGASAHPICRRPWCRFPARG